MKPERFLVAGGCAAIFAMSIASIAAAQIPSQNPVNPPATAPTPTTTATPAAATAAPTARQIDQTRPISLETAIERALKLTTALTAAGFETQIAAEDVKQARAAFLPKITAPLSIIYTSPSLMNTRPREPSFISADAVTVYQALLSAEGEIDTSGKLRATLQKNIALVDAARAGSEVARRELQQSVVDAYYTLALSSVKRRGAESNLQAAITFEDNQRLQLDAGEIAPIDLVRARLQTEQRRDELLQARTDETIAADALKILVGAVVADTIAAADLLTQLPIPDEIERFSEATITSRPEFAQFAAQKRAADFDVRAAKADLLPQVTYQVSSGFITDSLAPGPVKNHSGIQATVGVTIPIFDWGATRSRIAQAKIRSSIAEANRAIAERQFVQAFYSAREQALAARARIDLLRQSITDAQNSVTTSIARYRAGEAPLTEVVDAQNTLVTQRTSFYQALFDYQTAKARLARAAGK